MCTSLFLQKNGIKDIPEKRSENYDYDYWIIRFNQFKNVYKDVPLG